MNHGHPIFGGRVDFYIKKRWHRTDILVNFDDTLNVTDIFDGDDELNRNWSVHLARVAYAHELFTPREIDLWAPYLGVRRGSPPEELIGGLEESYRRVTVEHLEVRLEHITGRTTLMLPMREFAPCVPGRHIDMVLRRNLGNP